MIVKSSKVAQWGNSAAVRLTTATLEEAALRIGDAVELVAGNGEIISAEPGRASALRVCWPSLIRSSTTTTHCWMTSRSALRRGERQAPLHPRSVVCPITSKMKGSPFEVVLPPHLKTKGCVVASEVRTQDYFARGVQFVEKTPQALLHAVQAIACAVLGCP